MPLESGAKPGSPGFGRNIATEERAGKPSKQAEAIAYSKARGDAVDFGELKRQLSEFLSEEAREPEHKADALQPNPWANKIAALNGGIDSLTARLAR